MQLGHPQAPLLLHAAFALLVPSLMLAGYAPPRSCSLLRISWLVDPFYLDSHIDLRSPPDTDSFTAFDCPASSLSCQCPLAFDLPTTKLPCLLNVWLAYLSSLPGLAPQHVCAAAFVQSRRLHHSCERLVYDAMAMPSSDEGRLQENRISKELLGSESRLV